MSHAHIPTSPNPRDSIKRDKPPTLVVRPIDEDEFVLRVEYVDRMGSGVIATEDVDLGPKPTWPTPQEQSDMVALTVRNVWDATWEFYTGDKIERTTATLPDPVINPEPEVVLPEPLDGMTGRWKSIRRAADALAEVIDNAVNDLVEGLDIDLNDEPLMEAIYERVYSLVTKGE